jgi:hypothetical protein
MRFGIWLVVSSVVLPPLPKRASISQFRVGIAGHPSNRVPRARDFTHQALNLCPFPLLGWIIYPSLAELHGDPEEILGRAVRPSLARPSTR